MSLDTKTEIEAAVFRKFVKHLDNNKDVQNIDLMNLADFCRNCLSKWYKAEAESRGENIDMEECREIIYGMPYSEWKEKHQLPATPTQMAAFEKKQQQKQSQQ